MLLLHKLIKQMFLWGFWVLYPICIEIGKGLINITILVIKAFKKPIEPIDYYPVVTLLIPVYNSRNTLQMCLNSIIEQTYPVKNIEVFLIDNGSNDDSFEVFQQFQMANPKLKVWWYTSKQGKAKALNMGIFTSSGKYIINIDSDGWLDKDAIFNIVTKFERDTKISCMTGTVLIEPKLINETKNKKLRLLQKCEFFEYIEAFLIGRNFESTFNSMYTLAGAFSCFRKEAILKTQMYNSETLGEDTHMTFQIRKFVGGKITLCNNAFFYVDPIEGVNKLYTQRQRWQRSEIEVARLFGEYYPGGIFNFIKSFTQRILIMDHTLAFSKFLWFFALFYLFMIDYSPIFLIVGNLLLYFVYVINSLLYARTSLLFLKGQDETIKFIKRNWYCCFLMSLYRFGVFFIRLAGIINSMSIEATWKTNTLSDEMQIFKNHLSIHNLFCNKVNHKA